MQGPAAIVTGGVRGLGGAISLSLAHAGLDIIMVGRSTEGLAALATTIEATGSRWCYVPDDVRDPRTAGRTLEQVGRLGWHVSALVCNAGIGKGGPTQSFDVDVWKDIFDVNVHGSFHFIRAFLPGMVERRLGRICLISSLAGIRGFPHDAAYTASKHALVGLARSLAMEHGKDGIVVVPVCPGPIEGEMTDRVIRGLMERHGICWNDAQARVEHASPLRRLLSADEVASEVRDVCLGRRDALTGSPLVLGGGG